MNPQALGLTLGAIGVLIFSVTMPMTKIAMAGDVLSPSCNPRADAATQGVVAARWCYHWHCVRLAFAQYIGIANGIVEPCCRGERHPAFVDSSDWFVAQS